MGRDSASPILRCWTFDQTERQTAELRDFCASWATGSERFWEFDETLSTLSRPGSFAFFASPTSDGPWHGFTLADVGPFSADLLYVYVRPSARQSGVGRLLLTHLIDELARRHNIEELFLEVRASNRPAQRLYETLGMTRVGQRKAYYANGEDALVYRFGFDRKGS